MPRRTETGRTIPLRLPPMSLPLRLLWSEKEAGLVVAEAAKKEAVAKRPDWTCCCAAGASLMRTGDICTEVALSACACGIPCPIIITHEGAGRDPSILTLLAARAIELGEKGLEVALRGNEESQGEPPPTFALEGVLAKGGQKEEIACP